MRIARSALRQRYRLYGRMSWQWCAPCPRGRLLRVRHLHWSAVQASVSKTIMRLTVSGAELPIASRATFGRKRPHLGRLPGDKG